MKRKFFNILILFLSVGSLVFICSCEKVSRSIETKTERSEITVDGQDGIIFVGSKKEVETGKRNMKGLIDPADDYVMDARQYYRKGDYQKSEEYCKKGLREAKHNIVKLSGHNTLLDIYKATRRYNLAIQEIDWLLANVNEYAKPDLIKQKEKLQELLKTQE